MAQSELEAELTRQLMNAGLPQPENEYPTGHGRHRFDFAWPELALAVEVEGGTYIKGRHSRGAGYAGDTKKYNEAAIAGWTVIRVTTDMLRTAAAIDYITRAILSCSARQSMLTTRHDGAGALRQPKRAPGAGW